jgi:hypothetical protein
MTDMQISSSKTGPTVRPLLMIVALVYLLTAKGYIEVSDTLSSLQTAEAIVTRGKLDISPNEATLTAADGKCYSKYGIGLAAAFVPLVGISHILGTVSGRPPLEIAGFLISFLNVPLTLLMLILFGRLLVQLGTAPAYSRLLTAGLALGTLCWRYAVYDFSEGMQTALLISAVYGVLGGGSDRRLFLGGLGFAGLVLVKLVHVALLPFFVGYLIWSPGTTWRERAREAAFFVAPVVLALALVAWLNTARFGSPLETGYGKEARQFLPAQLPETLPQLLVSMDKGLFVFCPVLVLGVAGWPSFFRRYPREAALCGGLVLGNLLLAGAWHSWVGGWSWGPRLLVPAIPLWLLPAGFAFGGSPSGRIRASVAALVLISATVQIPGVLVKDQEISHIRHNMLTASERPAFSADWSAAWILLRHKLTSTGEVYSVAELGLPGDRHLDLSMYRTFLGINVWTEHIPRQLHIPLLRWLPLAGFAAILMLGVGAMRASRRTSPDSTAKPG